MRRISLLLTSTLLLVALFTMIQGTAFASTATTYSRDHISKAAAHFRPNTTCAQSPSDANCDGLDPIAQGCQGDARTVTLVYVYDPGPAKSGEVDLRYSSKCKSNWARTISYIGTQNMEADITRSDGLNYYTGDVVATSVYSAMVYAPVLKAQACGFVGAYLDYKCTNYV